MKKKSPATESAQGTVEQHCKKAFPGFELEFDLPKGFVDTSWHHNESPSFDKPLADGTVIRLWVDYADRSRSRCTDEEPYFRFSLVRYTADEVWIANLGSASTPQAALDLVAMYDVNL
jgi:hypothetical protein